MKAEDEIQGEIRLALARHECVLLRNNSGVLRDLTGRPIRYGWGNESKKQNENWKSPDLLGITTITITPDMVGRQIGVITGIEVKEEAWNPMKKLDSHELAQRNALDWIKARGGIAGFANSVASAMKIIGR